MQTFLPYPSFVESARCLDYRRLGKQRVEAYQILRTLTGESQGWKNHPAVLMWEGYPQLLACYGAEICTEWIRRGYRDSIRPKFRAFLLHSFADEYMPVWFEDERLHASHRSNLLRKDPTFYGRYGWTEPDNLPYYWPTKGES